MKKITFTQDDYLKANRIASRNEEIEKHGHPICYSRVHKSKKVYNRKKNKADNDLPYFFVVNVGRCRRILLGFIR